MTPSRDFRILGRPTHEPSQALQLGVVSLGIGLLVGFLAKGKKHWFTIEFEGVADHPENYHYLRLDKGNYRRILQAVEAATGLDVEVLEED